MGYMKVRHLIEILFIYINEIGHLFEIVTICNVKETLWEKIAKPVM